MADALFDRLDRTIDALIAREDASAALGDPELAPLARLAADLRHYPSPSLKTRLRAQLERRIKMVQAFEARGIREGFTTVTPYIRVSGSGLAAFLTSVFDAGETHKATGSAGGVHREMRIGNSMVMIGEGTETAAMPIRPAAFHVYVEDVDGAFQRAIAAGGESMGDPEDRFYGERSGFVKDPFGNHWYIARSLGPSYIPEGLRTVTPYLLPADAPACIEFLKKAFGAVEEGRHAAPDGRIMHAQLRIGNAALELGQPEQPTAMASGFYLYVGDADALYEQAIGAGAKSLWAPRDEPYGDRVGAVEDAMGNQWFIARPA